MLPPIAIALMAAWHYADAERPHRPAPASAPTAAFPARRLPASFLPGPIDLAALIKLAPPRPATPPSPPGWFAAEGREGVEIYGRRDARGFVAVERWRFAGTAEEHPGKLPPNVGLRWWYRLTGHPGIEGYGLIGPSGVVVERWRYEGTTEEHAGAPTAPLMQLPAPMLAPSFAPMLGAYCPPGGT